MKYYEATLLVEKTGRLPIYHGEKVRDVLKELAGKQIHFVIEQPKRYSTNPQRNYYFAAIVTTFQDYFAKHGKWYDKDELHEMMMTEIGELWEEKPNPFTETITKKRKSYNSLSTIEAEEYHTKCRAYAAEKLQIDIQEPNEEEK